MCEVTGVKKDTKKEPKDAPKDGSIPGGHLGDAFGGGDTPMRTGPSKVMCRI